MKRFQFPIGILFILFVNGCGSGLEANPILFNETRALGPSGGGLASPDASVSFAAGTLSRETPVTLTVFAEQFPEIAHDGYLHSEEGVSLRFDPTAVAPDQALELELGHQGDYNDFGTMLAVMKDDGAFLALPSEEAGPGRIKGTLSKELLALLFPDAAALEQQDLRIFSANRILEVEAEPLETSVEVFDNGAFSGPPPDLTGKRVALVVHGLDSSLADLTSLGQFIHSFKLTGQPNPYYDVVLGYQYSSSAPLAEIGADLAGFMNTVGLQHASAADLFAHSMGNLVSRYAMETLSLPQRIANVDHYVSLGGPHDGVPFDNLSYAVQTFFYLFPLAAEPCIRDLLTDGKEGEPETGFLENLNLSAGQQGPNLTTTQYYTMSGSDWDDYDPPVGYTVSYLYWLSVGEVGAQVIEDGLVGDYSAQSSLLARQSQSWTANPPLDLSHTGLHDSPEAFNQLADWMSGWQ